MDATTSFAMRPQRLRYPKLCEFKWETEEMSEPGHLVSPDKNFKALLDVEDCVFRMDEETEGFKQLLGVPTQAGLALGQSKLNAASSMTCSFLTAYRLLDVKYSLMNDRDDSPCSQIVSFQPQRRSPLTALTDWPSVLKEFYKTIRQENPEISQTASLLQGALAAEKSVKNLTIVTNFCIASAHLRVILLGYKDRGIPDLPCKADLPQLFKNTFKIENLNNKVFESPYSFRRTLHFCTLLSPIGILMAQRLDQCKIQNLPEIFFQLGTWRPPVIRCLEKKIWRSLFDVATASDPTYANVLAALIDIRNSKELSDAIASSENTPSHTIFPFPEAAVVTLPKRRGKGFLFHSVDDDSDEESASPAQRRHRSPSSDALRQQEINLHSSEGPLSFPRIRHFGDDTASGGDNMEVDMQLDPDDDHNTEMKEHLQSDNVHSNQVILRGRASASLESTQASQTTGKSIHGMFQQIPDGVNIEMSGTQSPAEHDPSRRSANNPDASPPQLEDHDMEEESEDDISTAARNNELLRMDVSKGQREVRAASLSSSSRDSSIHGDANESRRSIQTSATLEQELLRMDVSNEGRVIMVPSLPSSDAHNETHPNAPKAANTQSSARPNPKVVSASRSLAARSSTKMPTHLITPVRTRSLRPPLPPKATKKNSDKDALKSKVLIDESESNNSEVSDEDDYEEYAEGLYVKRPKITLDPRERPKIPCDVEIVAYTATGEKRIFKPNVHDPDILQHVLALSKAVQESFRDGMPLHCHPTAKAESVFCIFSEDEFEALSDREVQNIFRSKHIVIHSQHHKRTTFVQAVLTLGGGLDRRTDIQGMYQSLPSDENKNNIIRCGTIAQLLAHANSPTGNSLNALNFPMAQASMMPTSFASDTHALLRTSAMITRAEEQNSIPTSHFRWGISTLDGGYHGFHVDSNGLATYVCPITGRKWWVVLRPIGNLDFSIFEDISVLLNPPFDVNGTGDGLFSLEAVLLEPGTTLIMRPNTLHAVYTPENTVVHGGHFFATSTMKDSLAAILHSLVLNELITNTDHPPAYAVIRRLIDLYHSSLVEGNITEDDPVKDHIPDLRTRDGLIDLLSICTIGRLLNVIDLRTYGDQPMPPNDKRLWNNSDVTPLPLEDRLANQIARGQCMQLLMWADANYIVFESEDGEAEQSILNIQKTLFERHLRLLQIYKFSADKNKAIHRPTFNVNSLSAQIKSVAKHSNVSSLEESNTFTHVAEMLEVDRKLFNSLGQLRVMEKNEKLIHLPPPPLQSTKVNQLLDLGCSDRDAAYELYRKVKSEEKSSKKRKIVTTF